MVCSRRNCCIFFSKCI